MNLTIFIKTHKGDLEWLKYCLTSLKYFNTPHKLVLIADDNCDLAGQPIPRLATVLYVPTPENGYILQQVYKLSAHKYTSSPYILFLDSDTVFTQSCTLDDFFYKDTPIHFYEAFERVGNANCWKAPTEEVLKTTITHEYMRRFPIVHHRNVLFNLEYNYPNLINNLRKKKDRRFSEFNVLGAFAHLYHKELYHWYEITDTTPPPPPVAKQFWSWGGITPEIRKELECICGTI